MNCVVDISKMSFQDYNFFNKRAEFPRKWRQEKKSVKLGLMHESPKQVNYFSHI